jgi:drug/metabolite transporter (DMT)-like permease
MDPPFEARASTLVRNMTMTASKPRAASKPTAAAALAARLRDRLPEPVRRQIPPWHRARPWTLMAAGAVAVLVASGAVFGINLLLEFDRHPTVQVDTDPYEVSFFDERPRYVLVLGSSWLFLGESISVLRIAGVVTLLVGVILISQS